MITGGEAPRDLSRLVVPLSGSLETTGDLFQPFRLIDADGVVMAAAGPSSGSLPRAGGRLRRSGRMGWTCCAGGGSCGLWRSAGIRRPGRRPGISCAGSSWLASLSAPHWRYPGGGAPGTGRRWRRATPNPVTGKRSPGRGYATATVAHCESVLRAFYDFHLEAGTGPMVNPFPLARGRRGRANAHHNPMQPFASGAAAGTGRSWPGGCRGRSRMRCSISCSPRWARTGTGRWSRSGCRPGRGPASCWAPRPATPTRASS